MRRINWSHCERKKGRERERANNSRKCIARRGYRKKSQRKMWMRRVKGNDPSIPPATYTSGDHYVSPTQPSNSNENRYDSLPLSLLSNALLLFLSLLLFYHFSHFPSLFALSLSPLSSPFPTYLFSFSFLCNFQCQAHDFLPSLFIAAQGVY